MSFCTRPIVPAISAVAAPIAGDDRQRRRRVREQHGVAADHVDARRDHRRGVDQRGDRRRAFHRVRQPDVERDLRRLAGRAEEQQQRRDRRSRPSRRARPARAAGGGRDAPGSRACRTSRRSAASPRMKPKSPMRLTMNAFLPASAADCLLEPEADQQVRAEPDAFPADEHHREVRAEDQHEHERREQVQVREVARVLAVAAPRACSRSSRCGSASRCR